MDLRHCARCGRKGTLLLHRLDGYMSEPARVVWLCGPHWADAQNTSVRLDDLLPCALEDNPCAVALGVAA